jgi:hypothetical protein
MAAPGSGGVATATAADAAGASGSTSSAPLDQARSAANAGDDMTHPAGAGGSSGSDSGSGSAEAGERRSTPPPQLHHPVHPAAAAANSGGEGVRPQTHLSETAPSWSAADARHAAAHAHEEATARTADRLLSGRAGTPVETQITSDEEGGGTSSDDEPRGGGGGDGGGGGAANQQGQQSNHHQSQQPPPQPQQGGEQLLAAKALAAVAATAGVRAAKQQQQHQQHQFNLMGVHRSRSRAGSAASSAAGSGMAAAAEEMSVVLPEELRSVLEEVAMCGRSNRLPWVISDASAAHTASDSADADDANNSRTQVVEDGDFHIPFPPPFCGIESRRKRKNPQHSPGGGVEVSTAGQGESEFGTNPGASLKRPRLTSGSDFASESIYHDNSDNYGSSVTAKETSIPQFRTLRNVLQVSLALVLDGAYRVCSERSGVGYRACQAEREAWDRKRSGGTDIDGPAENLGDGTANGGIGSQIAMGNGSSSSYGIVGISPARPIEALEN